MPHKDPAVRKAYDAAWQKANPDKKAKYNAAWRKANPDKKAKNNATWQKTNRDKKNTHNARRRAIKKNAPPLFDDEMEAAEMKDFYARTPPGMTGDHDIPLAGCRVCGRKGRHEVWNMQYLTGPDNSAKGNRCQACWDKARGVDELNKRFDQWEAAGKPIPPKLPADGWGIIPEDPADDRFARWLEGPDYS